MSQLLTITPTHILTQAKRSGAIPQLIRGIIQRDIIQTAAAKAGLEVEALELQQKADQFRRTHKLCSRDATWEWLQHCGLPLDEFEEMMRLEVLTTKLAHHLFADQIEPYFLSRQVEYAQVSFYEIMFDDEAVAIATHDKLLTSQLTVFDLAHQNINALQTASYRRLLNPADISPELATTVFAAMPPQLLKPIMTAQGVYLLFVEAIIQPDLDDVLRQTILSRLFSAWLQQQCQDVDVTLDFLSALP